LKRRGEERRGEGKEMGKRKGEERRWLPSATVAVFDYGGKVAARLLLSGIVLSVFSWKVERKLVVASPLKA
jgi:hypothetical protein